MIPSEAVQATIFLPCARNLVPIWTGVTLGASDLANAAATQPVIDPGDGCTNNQAAECPVTSCCTGELSLPGATVFSRNQAVDRGGRVPVTCVVPLLAAFLATRAARNQSVVADSDIKKRDRVFPHSC